MPEGKHAMAQHDAQRSSAQHEAGGGSAASSTWAHSLHQTSNLSYTSVLHALQRQFDWHLSFFHCALYFVRLHASVAPIRLKGSAA